MKRKRKIGIGDYVRVIDSSEGCSEYIGRYGMVVYIYSNRWYYSVEFDDGYRVAFPAFEIEYALYGKYHAIAQQVCRGAG